jgi:hypothetical protein
MSFRYSLTSDQLKQEVTQHLPQTQVNKATIRTENYTWPWVKKTNTKLFNTRS